MISDILFMKKFYFIFFDMNNSIKFLYYEVMFLRVKIVFKLEVDEFVYKIFINEFEVV